MDRMFKKVLTIIIFSILIQQSLAAEIVKIFEFNDEEMITLQVRKLKGKTTYTLGSNDKGNYLKAESEGKASGLGKKVKINLIKTPFINITWKVEKDLTGINEQSKKGHDYAARVFIIKKTEIATRNPDAEIIPENIRTSKASRINPYKTQKISVPVI